MKVKKVEDVNVWTTSTYVVQYIAFTVLAIWPTLSLAQQTDILTLLGGETLGRYVSLMLWIGSTMTARGTRIEWDPPWRKKVDIEIEDSEDRP